MNDDSNDVRIDVSQIPTFEVKKLACALLNAVEKAYENPEFEAGFRQWKKERDKKKETNCVNK